MSQQRILEGKLAIVTGAARGIGAAIAENLAAKGANIVLNYTSDSSESTTAKLAQHLESTYGIKTLPAKANLGEPDGPKRLVDFIKQNASKLGSRQDGGFQIDIIINNAGVSKNYPIQDVDVADFDRQYHVNVRGPLLLIQAAEPYLPHDRSGRIVNVSSVSAQGGFAHQSVYSGTKAALDAMTRTWARELSERAICNSVNPGPVQTDMWESVTDEFKEALSPWVAQTPLTQIRKGIDQGQIVKDAEIMKGRPGYPSEIAGTVGMLCTPDAAFTTGSIVSSNGGMFYSR